jgi:hypothetical protein
MAVPEITGNWLFTGALVEQPGIALQISRRPPVWVIEENAGTASTAFSSVERNVVADWYPSDKTSAAAPETWAADIEHPLT